MLAPFLVRHFPFVVDNHGHPIGLQKVASPMGEFQMEGIVYDPKVTSELRQKLMEDLNQSGWRDQVINVGYRIDFLSILFVVSG